MKTDQALAETLLNCAVEHESRVFPPPDGFIKVGSGCSRTAYLHTETEVVYKVGARRWGFDANNAEVDYMSRCRSRDFSKIFLDFVVRFPETIPMVNNKYYSVIAQEYAKDCVPTSCGCGSYYHGNDNGCNTFYKEGIYTVYRLLREETGVMDLHYDNLLYNLSTKEFWLIDAGSA